MNTVYFQVYFISRNIIFEIIFSLTFDRISRYSRWDKYMKFQESSVKIFMYMINSRYAYSGQGNVEPGPRAHFRPRVERLAERSKSALVLQHKQTFYLRCVRNFLSVSDRIQNTILASYIFFVY